MNRDKRMSKDEFMRLVNEYENENEHGKKDEMSADEYWKQFSGPEGMDFKSFEAGYRHADQYVDQNTIDEAFKMGDADGTGHLSYEEFMRLVKMAEEGEDHDGEHQMTPEDYWNKYSDGKIMDIKSFRKGYRQADPNVSKDTIIATYKKGDTNGDRVLDEKEFYNLMAMMEKEGGRRLLSIKELVAGSLNLV
jgi:Ca2+-binding EF-hand superfamily protein